MTVDLSKLAALQKSSKQSFFQQKKLVTQVLAGQKVLCQECQQPLKFSSSEQAEHSGIFCPQGCTDIQLDCS